jgi:hypothetical protein
MVLYRGVDGFSGSLSCCLILMHIVLGFPRVSDVIFISPFRVTVVRLLCILYRVLYRVPRILAIR